MGQKSVLHLTRTAEKGGKEPLSPVFSILNVLLFFDFKPSLGFLDPHKTKPQEKVIPKTTRADALIMCCTRRTVLEFEELY